MPASRHRNSCLQVGQSAGVMGTALCFRLDVEEAAAICMEVARAVEVRCVAAREFGMRGIGLVDFEHACAQRLHLVSDVQKIYC